jgi:hypothetical protein
MGVLKVNLSKHTLIMIACCLIPLVAITAVTVFNVPLNNVILFGMVLLCPLGHILMMKYMMPGHEGEHHSHAPVVEKRKRFDA